ncbi:hypothetical protein F3Y22_tig00002840pilonHSYRG01285 [Hibiscus syriacus]|uniref:Plastocyanin-like domain-containing protein n=1 Tax=Hibiscus syriacus TaxID=106335 RepID=A0A6A3CSG7_HIBSY|nr:hypothetical protein F3Y22_tig00002840pilonHSYRG01285 [Hibiscus syriacus]
MLSDSFFHRLTCNNTNPKAPWKSFTYILQVKDQIGSFFYFSSLAFHKAAAGFGGIRILSRPRIPVPFPEPAGDYTVLIGDLYKSNHTNLKACLDRGKKLPFPMESLKMAEDRWVPPLMSNKGRPTDFGYRMLDCGIHSIPHPKPQVEVADQPAKDYCIAVSTRFTSRVLTSTAILRYSNSAGPVSGPPGGPTIQIDWRGRLEEMRLRGSFWVRFHFSGRRASPYATACAAMGTSGHHSFSLLGWES